MPGPFAIDEYQVNDYLGDSEPEEGELEPGDWLAEFARQFKKAEEVRPEIVEQLADIINKMMATRIPDDKAKEI